MSIGCRHIRPWPRSLIRVSSLLVAGLLAGLLPASAPARTVEAVVRDSGVTRSVEDPDRLGVPAIESLVVSEVAKLVGSDTVADDAFGYAVAVSGDTAIVGAFRNDSSGSGAGSAYIFERNHGGKDNWGQLRKLSPGDPEPSDVFGFSVGISSDTVVVGAQASTDAGEASGSAYVFERNHGGRNNWGEVKKLTALDAAATDRFGISAAISGDTIVVGAYGKDDPGENTGTAYVFERNWGGADEWREIARLSAPGLQAYDWFGYSVSISGNTIVVGAYGDDDLAYQAGAAYIFRRNEGGVNQWGMLQKILASDGAAYDSFGFAVSVSGDRALIGAYGDESETGSAYIFERYWGPPGTWTERTKLTASDGQADDRLGHAVSISGETALVGAYGNDDGGSFSGAAYLYARNEGGADAWGETQKCTASDAAGWDYFGYSTVAVSGDTLIVGAYGNEDAGPDSGSAYIFTEGERAWVEVAESIPGETHSGTDYGDSVSVSGDLAVVGGPQWLARPVGTSGAVWVLDRNFSGPDTWDAWAPILGTQPAGGDRFGRATAIDVDTLVVGVPYNDELIDEIDFEDAGLVEIHQRGGLGEFGYVTRFLGSDTIEEDAFGWSVDLCGNTLVVGVPGENVSQGVIQTGAVYVYERNWNGPDGWGEAAKLTNANPVVQDRFGESVAVSGDTIVVGAPGDDDAGTDSGSAFVYHRNKDGADLWGLVVQLTAADAAPGDSFGAAVGISGDTVAVGAPDSDVATNERGSAYVFERNQGGIDTWGELTRLVASDYRSFDFGASIAMSGDMILVGAPWTDTLPEFDTGAAYLFERNRGGADNWGKVQKLLASDPTHFSTFGESVDIDGRTLIVGSFRHDHPGSPGGAAYVFRHNGCPFWFADNDLDSFGDVDQSVAACTQPPGTVENYLDCDDGASETFPGAAPNDSATACMSDGDLDDYGDASPPQPGVIPGTDCDDSNTAVNPAAQEDCFNFIDDNCNGVADDLDPACGASTTPAGRVPDQDAWFGEPLRVDKEPNGDVTLTWAPSCIPQDSDYVVYAGTLGDFASHVSHTCTTGGATNRTVPFAVGSFYYFVAPRNLEFEGSLGTDGGGGERSPGADFCLMQWIIATCPANP